jgi:hypothetical protein
MFTQKLIAIASLASALFLGTAADVSAKPRRAAVVVVAPAPVVVAPAPAVVVAPAPVVVAPAPVRRAPVVVVAPAPVPRRRVVVVEAPRPVVCQHPGRGRGHGRCR